MERMSLIHLALRIFALLCACVVLGTSADLASFLNSDRVQAALKLAGVSLHGLISIIEYGAFTGAWGLLVTLAGIAYCFVSAIPWIAMIALDSLTALFYFAGAVAASVWLSNHDGEVQGPGVGSKFSEGKAATAFQYLGFLTQLGLIALVFFGRNRK